MDVYEKPTGRSAWLLGLATLRELLIGGRFTVLPTQAYALISGFGDLPGAAAVSTILLALALILYMARLRLEGNRSYVTVTGRASSMPRPPVPRGVT